jgi:hypothetical protein
MEAGGTPKGDIMPAQTRRQAAKFRREFCTKRGGILYVLYKTMYSKTLSHFDKS